MPLVNSESRRRRPHCGVWLLVALPVLPVLLLIPSALSNRFPFLVNWGNHTLFMGCERGPFDRDYVVFGGSDPAHITTTPEVLGWRYMIVVFNSPKASGSAGE
jgi:hypothetical protein